MIEDYRRKEALKLTMERRKDLLENFTYTKKDYEMIKEIKENRKSEQEEKAIEKGKKFTPKN